MPWGSRAWCRESMRISGSGSSTPGLSDTLTIQRSRPWSESPREDLAETNWGYAAVSWSRTEPISA